MKKNIHPVDLLVGNNLKRLRHLLNLSQEQVSAGLGITFQQIQKYEKGINRISASRLYEMAKLFGVTVADFFQGADDFETQAAPHHISAEATRVARDYDKISNTRSKQAIHNMIKAVAESPQDSDSPAE
ncbi:helix-turn-helix transcriptional regulator [Rhizobium sp. BK376]|uniref:helix-turn-helix domain-containing protein n=1 Tax=Rhizobium sp. BK376 TaxID=2512149 RepID=UPI001045EB56|nr:helix-turn-helix transcriptional regulator [Rhizobium sp. BK376]TCR62763.1 helix-turn-helix protein [Rhizobium sp. BK376]